MSDPSNQHLSPIGGEFKDAEKEAAFQRERMPETLRHIRLLFILSALLNTLFFLGDWRLHDQPRFHAVIPACTIVVVISLVCFLAAQRIHEFRQAQLWMLAWQWITGIAAGFLVNSRSDLALLVMIMLPSIYYLAVPTSFRWSPVSGIGCSLLMLAGYLSHNPRPETITGLIVVMAMLNLALILVVSRSNRLRRLEWSAIQSERRAKEELAESRSIFEALFRTIPLPLVVVRMDGLIVDANEAAVSYFGASREAFGIQSIDELYVDPEDRVRFISTLKRDGRVSDFETRVRLADGSVRNVLLVGTAVEIDGVDSVISGVIDITERKAAKQRIWRTASYDPLTDLPNRALFQSRFELALAQAEHDHGSLSLFLIDLDDFKHINDRLGQDAGDAFLREIAERLRRMTRDVDTVARLGGDEFVVTTGSPLGLEHAEALADRILEELRRPFAYNGELVSSTASIGVAVYPDHDGRPAELMRDADLALHSAKARGRNCALLFTPEMRNLVERRATITRDIQDALQNRRIVPFYQPKVNLLTGQVIGFEALARWDHPEHGLLTPPAFPAAFDNSELAIMVGEHMIREVSADIRKWLDQGIDCGRVAVNLSTAQFSWLGLAKRFLDIVQKAGVPTEHLDVEITETVFLGRCTTHVAAALRQFHENGIRIALDDFGTGYASLVHLKQFPVDDIKIDQSFVKDVTHDSESAAIVVAVIELGKSLGMNVIAEGVETAEQARFLRDKGCVFVQGNLYAPPMTAEDVAGFLARGKVVAL